MNLNHMGKGKDDENDNKFSSYCPSFSTYTANTQIADVVSRVVSLELNAAAAAADEGEFEFSEGDGEGDDGFEFGFVGSGIPEAFPVYPVFNRDLLRDPGSDVTSPGKTIQLRSLFFEEDSNRNGNGHTTKLSEEDEELEGVSPESYCLWAPKSPSPSPSPSRCMKSSSTGSGPAPAVSKTWRLRSLLRRCKSDGKEGLMLMNSGTKKASKEKSGKEKSSPPPPPSSSPSRGGSRRKSYLPYKQDLLGFFGSPQTLRKINIPPF